MQLEISGAKDIENKRQKALKLVQRLWEKVVLLSDSRISNLIAEPELIFDAARQGNLEFLLILIREYPDLIWNIDENGYTIFHTAVLHRRKRIFKLIYQIGAAKDLILKFEDPKKNNILHLAAMLPPQDRLNIVSGAALQMQRELLWFEVKLFVQHSATIVLGNFFFFFYKLTLMVFHFIALANLFFFF